MKFSAERESLLAALQSVIGVVERRQTMPILANLLLSADQGKLSITATDLEVEMVAEAEVKADDSGDITVPGRKLHDIFRALPEGAWDIEREDGDAIRHWAEVTYVPSDGAAALPGNPDHQEAGPSVRRRRWHARPASPSG